MVSILVAGVLSLVSAMLVAVKPRKAGIYSTRQTYSECIYRESKR